MPVRQQDSELSGQHKVKHKICYPQCKLLPKLRNKPMCFNKSQKKIKFDFIFVDEEDFEKYKPNSFGEFVKSFRKLKDK